VATLVVITPRCAISPRDVAPSYGRCVHARQTFLGSVAFVILEIALGPLLGLVFLDPLLFCYQKIPLVIAVIC
jgi:hypothetical protein